MKNLRNLYIALVLLIVLATLSSIAIHLYFYWTIWWFDILMHFLGGVVGGYFAVWLILDSRSIFLSPPSRKISFPLVIFLVLIFVVGWEGLEFVYKLPQPPANYVIDTSIDILMGLVGAGAAYVLATLPSRLSS